MKTQVRGSALLLVLMALFLLTAAVMAFYALVHAQLQTSLSANSGLDAKAMAHSGFVVAVASFQDATAKTRVFQEEVSVNPPLAFHARVIGEGSKLNIKTMLKPKDPTKDALLLRWLERHGLEWNERERLVACMHDWVDEDDLKELNGLEDEGDYHPANRDFETLDEITQVAGAGALLQSPGWQEELTLYGDGKIDLSAAEAPVLALLPGLSEGRIKHFLEIRRGKDGVDGTLDDITFKDTEQAFDYLGLGRPERKALGNFVTVNGAIVRIISEGRSGDIVRQLEVVTRKGGAKPQILYWKE